MRDARPPRWLCRLLRWVFRLFTGAELDGLTLPLPLVTLWLLPPSDGIPRDLYAHEATHQLQVASCWPTRGPWWWRELAGGLWSMCVWLALWVRCGFSYRRHPWEVKARSAAGQG